MERLSAGRLNHDFINDGQTIKKLLNHEDRAGLALSYSELCGGLPAGLGRLLVSSKTCTGVMFGASRAFALRKTCTGVVLGASRALKHAQM